MDDNPAQARLPNSGEDSSELQVSVPEVDMKNNPNLGMWVGFIHIVYFISLYFLATASANILHEYVNRFIKDPLEIETASRSYLGLFGLGSFKDYWLRFNLSSLLVSFPIFIFSFLYTKSLILKNSKVAELRSRHILIYATLVGTFLFFNYALIKVVYAFLDGLLTTRSILHTLISISISSIIFIYYLLEVKDDRK